MAKVKNLIQEVTITDIYFAQTLANILAEKGYEVTVTPDTVRREFRAEGVTQGAKVAIYEVHEVNENEGKGCLGSGVRY